MTQAVFTQVIHDEDEGWVDTGMRFYRDYEGDLDSDAEKCINLCNRLEGSWSYDFIYPYDGEGYAAKQVD